jgi:tripartite-type tricarboxylate transporter receptor subunit TctC
MAPEALKFYQDFFSKVSATDGWKQYLKSEGLVPEFVTGDELATQIREFSDATKPLVAGMVKNP